MGTCITNCYMTVSCKGAKCGKMSLSTTLTINNNKNYIIADGDQHLLI